MAEETDQLSDQEMYRIGMRRLDGGSIEWLIQNTGCSRITIQSAWEHCRKMLSQHLCGQVDASLSDNDIFDRSEECLRLLLHWHETLPTSRRLAKPPEGVDESDDLSVEL